MVTYTQGIKNKARNFLIKHAVAALTRRRKQSFLVTKPSFEAITDHFNTLLLQGLRFSAPEALAHQFYFAQARQEWYKLYDAVCTPKKAAQLKVLYLAGPEPLNDIQVLVKHGIQLANIWAVESDKQVYQTAVNSLKENNIQIKLHRGSLKEFFELVPHEFDIIYFDSCSPIISPAANPLDALNQIFLHKRLTGLSVLITNFSEPRENLNWGELLAPWFAPRSGDEVPACDHECLLEGSDKVNMPRQYAAYINEHLPAYYEKFLTHFVACLAAEMVPMWQSLSLSTIQNTHFLRDQQLRQLLRDLQAEVEASSLMDWLDKVPHHLLAPDAYPLLNWVRLCRQLLPKTSPLIKFLDVSRGQVTLGDALMVYALLKRFEEADSGFNTATDAVCSPELREVLATTDFFDRDMRLTTDIPMKNLLVDLLYGAYGYPHVANTNASAAIRYKAKDTWMYANSFVFDQCRYLYDFLPTMELIPNFFENPHKQIILRGCMDCIHRNHFLLNHDLFRWSFIEDLYDERFRQAKPLERLDLIADRPPAVR